MYLTRRQELMLNGEEGDAVRKSMELLTALGEVFEAEKMVPVESAHISGVSYNNLGDAGTEWLEEQAALGAKCRVRATLNPAGMDLDKWEEMGVPKAFAAGQKRVIKAFMDMGVEPTCTCTPYLIGHTPSKGSQVAWAESNAVCYVNSVLGARTNRESGPTTLASAMTGLAAYYGYRLTDNRRPEKIIEIDVDLESRLDYSALGYVTGSLLKSSVPYFKNMGNPDVESMKTLGAACATSGGIALWHGEGITPEAAWASQYIDELESIVVQRKDLEEAKANLVSNPENPMYCIGCPHCSLKEIKETADLVSGKNLHGKLWVFTSRVIYDQAKKDGLVQIIEEAGGKVYRDTCMVVAPLHDMGWSGVVTNSMKGGHYSVAHGFPTKILKVDKMIEEASL
jgi:predicted aconitase